MLNDLIFLIFNLTSDNHFSPNTWNGLSLHPSQVCTLNVSDRRQASLPEAGCSEIGIVPERGAEAA